MTKSSLAQLHEQFTLTTSALRVLGDMAVTMLESGDNYSKNVPGFERLFSTECDRLDEVISIMDDMSTDLLKIKDSAVIASLTGISIKDVRKVLWACDVEADHTDTMLADEDSLNEIFRRKLREADIAEQMRGAVSEWSGVEPELVAKVLYAAGEVSANHRFRVHRMERSPESLGQEEEFLAKLRAARQLKAQEREDIEQATLDHQPVEMAGDLPSQTPAELRAKFIADSMRHGVEMGDIAQALNMKKAAVEKLAGQLLGQVLPEPPRGKAVNE